MVPETGGGSVPAALRNAFLDLIENDARGDEACRLAAQLSGCTDVLPFEHCEILELPAGSTFAQAAESVRETLGCHTFSCLRASYSVAPTRFLGRSD